MRCPACGHDNSDLATRCSACGAELIAAETGTEQGPARHMRQPDEPSDSQETFHDTPDEQREVPATGDTERRRQPAPLERDEDEDTDPFDDTDLDGPDDYEDLEEDYDNYDEDFGGELRRRRRTAPAKVATFVSGHQRMLGVAVALVVVGVLGVAWLVMSLASSPDLSQMEQDLRSHIPTYAYSGGMFATDGEAPLADLAIVSRQATSAPDEGNQASGVGPSAYLVVGEATYADEHVRIVRKVEATYVRGSTGWSLTGDVTELSCDLFALAGVDEAKVIENVGQVLQAASTQDGSDLAALYAGGSFEVVNELFTPESDADVATDAIAIACRSGSGFVSYSGGVNALFAFEEGQWKLRIADADEAATTRDFSSLIGTWWGEAIDHEATGRVCYGAETQGLSLVIESIAPASADQCEVYGTLYGIVHNHGELDRQRTADVDDRYVEMVPFWGTLTYGADTGEGSTLTLEATCELDLEQPEEADDGEDEVPSTRPSDASQPGRTSSSAGGAGTLDVSFVVHFGSSWDPAAVTCELTSTYTYDEAIFLVMTRQTQARFTDTYQLTHLEQ